MYVLMSIEIAMNLYILQCNLQIMRCKNKIHENKLQFQLAMAMTTGTGTDI